MAKQQQVMVIDLKLQHIVKKILETSNSNSNSNNTNNNINEIISSLTSSYREYLRKDPQLLRDQVTTILHNTTTLDSPSPPSANQKRQRQVEDQAEAEALVIEQDRKRLNTGTMLNNSLRCSYSQRQLAAQAAAVTTDVSSAPGTPLRSSSGGGGGGAQEQNEEGDAAVTPATATGAKKKKKKSGNSLKSSTSKAAGKSSSAAAAEMSSLVERPTTRYSDLGGIEDILRTVREIVEYPLLHPEVFTHLGVDPPRGVLLRGPPGCGKTLLAHAVAGQLGVAFIKISAPEIVNGISGESEQKLRELFTLAAQSAPSILFIDEIDAIAPKRDGGGSSRGMEKRIVAQLLTCMDDLAPDNTAGGKAVMVLGATNRPDALDSALRRAGRFDREICMGVPDEAARERILKVMTGKMKLSGDFDYRLIAKKTPGYVGADIRSLTKEAAVIAINRIFSHLLGSNDTEGGDITNTNVELANSAPLTQEQLDPLNIVMDDFLEAVKRVQPSSKREGFATVPDVSWDQIGALGSIREELSLSVLEPISNPERFEELGLPLPAGVMLYGPPGCGKTLLAKAIAHESGANFISVKGPELLDKYVGESERAVRQVFERARASSPCVVFFDELDSLCPKRGADGGSGGVSERVVNQLLTEMDGLESRRSVFVIAATNRPELIDPAMMRPGRLDKLLYVPLPTPDDRVSILKALAKRVNLSPDVNLDEIARSPRADCFSGADCAALLREAGLAVLRDSAAARVNGETKVGPLQVCRNHFDYAFDHVMPSVSKKDQKMYDRMRDRMARARSRTGGVKDKEEKKDGTNNNSTETTSPYVLA